MKRDRTRKSECRRWTPGPPEPGTLEIDVLPGPIHGLDLSRVGLTLLQQQDLDALRAAVESLLAADDQESYQKAWPSVVSRVSRRGCIDPMEPAFGESLVSVDGKLLPESLVRAHLRKQLMMEALPAVAAAARGAAVAGQALARGAAAAGRVAVQGASAVGRAAVSGARAAGTAIKTGVQAAGRAVASGARAVGRGATSIARNAPGAIKAGAREVGKAVGKTARTGLDATKQFGKGVKQGWKEAGDPAEAEAQLKQQAANTSQALQNSLKQSLGDPKQSAALLPALEAFSKAQALMTDPQMSAKFASELAAAINNLPSVKAAVKAAEDARKQQSAGGQSAGGQGAGGQGAAAGNNKQAQIAALQAQIQQLQQSHHRRPGALVTEIADDNKAASRSRRRRS